MTASERFKFTVPTYYPAAIPWELVGTMAQKVLRKEFDWELGIHTTYLVGCCLTVAASSQVPFVPPKILSASCPDDHCSDDKCKALADNLLELKDFHISDTNPNTAGFAAPSINPATLMTLIQLAIQILSLIGKPKT